MGRTTRCPFEFCFCLSQIEPMESLGGDKKVDRAVWQPRGLGSSIQEYTPSAGAQPPTCHAAHIGIGLYHIHPATPRSDLLCEYARARRNVGDNQTGGNGYGFMEE